MPPVAPVRMRDREGEKTKWEKVKESYIPTQPDRGLLSAAKSLASQATTRKAWKQIEGTPKAEAGIPQWAKSKSLSLRNYRFKSLYNIPAGMVGLERGPPNEMLQQFMLEGATDEELLSRWPFPKLVLQNARKEVGKTEKMLRRKRSVKEK